MTFIIENSDTIDINLTNRKLYNSPNWDTTVSELLLFLSDIINGKSNYKVEIIDKDGNNPSQRDGSIGEIKNITIPYHLGCSLVASKNDLKDFNLFYPTLLSSFGRVSYSTPIRYLSEYDFTKITLSVFIDKKHSIVKVPLSKIRFIKDHTVQNKYCFVKSLPKKQVETILKDKFDNEFTIGSFICFANSTSKQQAIPLFGKVTKINQTYFEATSMKLSSSDRERSVILRNPKEVILMTDDLMDQIMIARLTF